MLLVSLYLVLSVRDASRQVRHTEEARVALLKLESIVVDAEAGARGYAASDNLEFLEPYASAVTNHREAFESTWALTMDNDAQHRRLAALQPLIEQEFGALEEIIEAHSRDAVGEELVPLLTIGKQTMDDIRRRVAELLHEEERQDVRAIRSESTKISVTFAVLLTGVVLIVAGAARLAKMRQLEKRAFERERQGREEAERASKLAELFVAVLGHDLRTPLGAITASGSLLARDPRDERERRIATRILGSSGRMTRMIDQILDFSRIRAGRSLLQSPAPMDLRELIGRVRDELSGGSSIQVDADGATEGVWDRDRLAQVFSNLLANAVEHSPAGSAVHVRVDGRPSEHVEVTVENPGAIPADILPEVFEPFRQGRQQDKARGLGLGLYISKEIVGAHGGTIGVTSSESSGTRFRVHLPRTAPTNPTTA